MEDDAATRSFGFGVFRRRSLLVCDRFVRVVRGVLTYTEDLGVTLGPLKGGMTIKTIGLTARSAQRLRLGSYWKSSRSD